MPTKRCQDCGREGTRGFHIIPAQTWTFDFGPGRRVVVEQPPKTVCASPRACMKRWPPVIREGKAA